MAEALTSIIAHTPATTTAEMATHRRLTAQAVAKMLDTLSARGQLADVAMASRAEFAQHRCERLTEGDGEADEAPLAA